MSVGTAQLSWQRRTPSSWCSESDETRERLSQLGREVKAERQGEGTQATVVASALDFSHHPRLFRQRTRIKDAGHQSTTSSFGTTEDLLTTGVIGDIHHNAERGRGHTQRAHKGPLAANFLNRISHSRQNPRPLSSPHTSLAPWWNTSRRTVSVVDDT